MALTSCPVCFTMFESTVDRGDKGCYERQYCSQDCARLSRRRIVELVCRCCGLLFSVVPSIARRVDIHGHARQYCSSVCRDIARITKGRKKPPMERIMHSAGYILIHAPDHPEATERGYMLEHRLVMEHVLGRRLTAEEVVHHKDEHKDHNWPGNLQLYASQAEHNGMHKHAMWAKYRAQFVQTCVQCGERFQPDHSAKFRPGRGRFCSRHCWDLSRRTRVQHICEHCGITFDVDQYRHQCGKGRFCSNACKVHGTALLRDHVWNKGMTITLDVASCEESHEEGVS